MDERVGASELGAGHVDRPHGVAGAPDSPRRRHPVARAFVGTLKLLVPVAILAGAVAAYAALKESRPVPAKRPPAEKVWPVEAVTVRFESISPMLHLYGETVAGRKVVLRPLVSGPVVEVHPGLREGGIVKKGETLLVIDPFDYEGAVVEARARLEEAAARLAELEAALKLEEDALESERRQLALAEKDLARARPLVKRGAASKKLLDDRQLIVTQRRQAVEQRENNLKVWRARIAQQQAARARFAWLLRQAERRLAETRLKAPFDAYVTDANAEVGQRLSVNDRVATLIDRRWIEARFTLSNQQYGRILAQAGTLIGRAVEVRWQVGKHRLTYHARITHLAATIAATKGGVTVYARLDDPLKPSAIRPGAFVDILMPDRSYDAIVRLPETAVYGNDTVYVINGKGRLEPRKVEVVGIDEGQVLVQGAVRAGEKVVRTRLSAPNKGLRVEVL